MLYKSFLTYAMVSKQILEQVLRELQPLCTTEQQFIEKFFQLSHDAADLEVSVRILSSPVPSAIRQSSLQLVTAGKGVTAYLYQITDLLSSSGVSSGEARDS